MVATIQDVARRAGVSIATVSRVLNRSSHPVSEAVRQRVEAAARELDYHPSSLARGLAGRETQTLGLVVPDIANPYYPRLSRGVEDVASSHGYAVILCSTDYRAEKVSLYLRLLREKHVDGILLAGGGHEDRADLIELASAGIPLQAIGRHGLEAPSVRIDNVASAEAATRHLIDTGRQRIAFLGGPFDHTTVADRREGYRRALRAAGRRLNRALEVETDFSPAQAEAQARRLMGRPTPPDGLFAANDTLAVAAIAGILKGAQRVPEEVGVIGFDDFPLAPYLCPSLSSVAVPAYELGVVATEQLLRRLAGESVSETLWLAAPVVARDSTRVPAAVRLSRPARH